MNANAPAIYGALKGGASGAEIAELFSLTAEESLEIIGELLFQREKSEFFRSLKLLLKFECFNNL